MRRRAFVISWTIDCASFVLRSFFNIARLLDHDHPPENKVKQKQGIDGEERAVFRQTCAAQKVHRGCRRSSAGANTLRGYCDSPHTDQAHAAMLTGILTNRLCRTKLTTEATRSGKRQYPSTQSDWKKETRPPNSFALMVTTTEPTQTREMTIEKT